MNDKTTTLQKLKDDIKAFCDERDWEKYHNPKDLAMMIGIEAAELQDHFRWQTNEELQATLANPKKREEIGEEIADVLYWVLRFADLNGFDLVEEFTKKMGKNAANYPVEKCHGKSHKYTTYKD